MEHTESANGSVPAHPPWEQTIPNIVDSWLFPPDVTLPRSLVIPLENPHLHNAARWQSVFGAPESECGVISIHSTASGHRFGVARPVMGAAATAMLVDAAAYRGADCIVGVGYCGGTSKELASGDLVVAASAIGHDGVSSVYMPDASEMVASSVLLEVATDRAQCGCVCSVAAVHLEDQRLIDECEARGVLGVDLETAAVLAVAAKRGVHAVTCLVVSDMPARGEHADIEALPSGEIRALSLALELVTTQVGRCG